MGPSLFPSPLLKAPWSWGEKGADARGGHRGPTRPRAGFWEPDAGGGGCWRQSRGSAKVWATRARFCSGDAESSRLQLKLEERELEKRVKSWKTLAVHALLFQILLQHFCVPRIILDTTGNQWGTKGLNFPLHEVFMCPCSGRACPPSSGCQPAVTLWGLLGCRAGGDGQVPTRGGQRPWCCSAPSQAQGACLWAEEGSDPRDLESGGYGSRGGHKGRSPLCS